MPLDAYTYREIPGLAGAPLVFAFHGTGGDETQFLDLIQSILPKAAIIAPRGDVSEHGANRFFKRTGEGVYDMADLSARTAKMGDFMRAHKAAHPGRPVYAMGYSNGANILASVMLQMPDIVDRAALLHPLIPWHPQAQPGLSGAEVLITAGAHDPICPLPMTQDLITYFQAQARRVGTTIHPGGHEVRPEEIEALQAFLQTDGDGLRAAG